jgi:molecular chaperone GrpE
VSEFDHDTSPAGAGGDPPGGPAHAGQRPGGSHSEPAAEDRKSRFEPDDAAIDVEGGGAADGGGSTEPAAESAEGFPAEAGREADEGSGAVDQVPGDDPLSEALRERDDYRDALIRLQADFENYKKRMLKQQTEYLELAASQLVDKLLPVLDAADLAMAHGGGEDVKQVTGALINALEKEGLERIAGEGSPFDPTLHDAVVHEPAEEEGEQTVSEVLRAGYKWKGRVLRPAMVKVRG